MQTDQPTTQSMHTALSSANLGRIDVEDYLRQYGQYIGIPDISFNDQNSVSLSFPIDRTELTVTLTYLDDRPGVFASMDMPDSKSHRPQILKLALYANESWRNTYGGSFGIVPGSNQLTLNRFIPIISNQVEDFDLALFDEQLATFIEVCRLWQQDLEQFIDNIDDTDNQPLINQV